MVARDAAVPVTVYAADSRPRLLAQLRQVVAHRELLLVLVQRDLKVRYKQTVLGALWAVLPPLLLMVVFSVFLGRLGRTWSGALPYPVFVYAGLLLWNYFSSAVAQATTSIVSHQSIVGKVWFPREILPWVPVLGAGVDFLVASAVFAGLVVYYHVPVGWTAVYAVPLLAVLMVYTAGISLAFAAFNTYFRDVRYLVPLVLQVWMFASPVVYAADAVPGWLQPYYRLANPVGGVIDLYRGAVVGGVAPDMWSLVGLAAEALAVFAACYAIFKRVERNFADVV